MPVTSPRTEHSAKEFLFFVFTWVCEFALGLGEENLGEFMEETEAQGRGIQGNFV